MKLGIIGGSGVYDLEGLEHVEHESVTTPFGEPSGEIVCGTLGGNQVYFLARHGKGHRIMPSEINHRANILALKELGVERVLSVSAVGSLREEVRPRDIVLPDQYFDRTKASRRHTFFGDGMVAHVSFGEPCCADLRRVLTETARAVIHRDPERQDVRINEGGTYVNMEGPAFSTRAESNVYRQLGFDVIGMTSLGEAKLCREAEMCYQAMAMVTDYDCWHETEEIVSVEIVIAHMMANSTLAKEIVRELVTTMPGERKCECANSLTGAIITQPEVVPVEVKKKLAPIVGKYM